MAISDQQKRNRQGHLGSSDIPAILGLDPFRTKLDIYKSKVEPLPEEEELKQKSARWYGNHLEEAILAMSAEILGHDPAIIHQDGITEVAAKHESGVIGVHVDMILPNYLYRGRKVDEPLLIEAKTSGFAGQPVTDDWGRAGSDQVPTYIMIQCQAHFLCFPQAKRLALPKLNGHNAKGLQMYFIKPSQKIGAYILKECNEFWHGHVIPQIPPTEE